VTLLLVSALLAVALFALLWGGSLIAQGYLYQQPADRLPVRAVVASLLITLFMAFWIWIDKNNPGKYDTFFEFAPYSTTTFSEFEAVRWSPVVAQKGKIEIHKDEKGNPIEKSVKFKRAPGSKGEFHEEGTNHPFILNDAQMMTAALVLKPDDGGNPARFKAELKKDDRTGNVTYTGERRFLEENGSRYVRSDQIGVLYVPSTTVVVLSLLLNFLLFVVWLAALWPVLRFSFGHALGFAAVFGLTTMLLVLPLLFKPNRAAKAPAAVATVVQSSLDAVA
jgi:hypothetical protein